MLIPKGKLFMPPHSQRPDPAFTLIELMVVVVVLALFSTMGLRSMFVFNEQRKLRTAAVELAGYLQLARTAANAANTPCTIALDSANGGSFKPASAADCKVDPAGAPFLPPSVRLGGLAGSRKLQATVRQGSFPLTFTPEGTTELSATVELSSVDAPGRSWCVNVQAPLATVRLGWLNGDQCTYTVDQ